MNSRCMLLAAALVLAQLATENFKGKAEIPRDFPKTAPPRDGYWAPPAGEAGASRHAPLPGLGGLPPAEGEEEVRKLHLEHDG